MKTSSVSRKLGLQRIWSMWPAIVLAACFHTGWAQDETRAEAEDTGDLSFVVIELHYANAYEMAELLMQVAPPNVRIVPLGPTNSLLISGPADVIGAAADTTEDGLEDGTEDGTEGGTEDGTEDAADESNETPEDVTTLTASR